MSDAPTLPDSLLDLIAEYGLARTDGLSDIARYERWENLIVGIKEYALTVRRATPPEEPKQASEALVQIAYLGRNPGHWSTQQTLDAIIRVAERALASTEQAAPAE